MHVHCANFIVPKCSISNQSRRGSLRADGASLGTIRPLELPGAQIKSQWSKEQTGLQISTVLVASVYRHPTNSVQQIMADLDDFEGQIQ